MPLRPHVVGLAGLEPPNQTVMSRRLSPLSYRPHLHLLCPDLANWLCLPWHSSLELCWILAFSSQVTVAEYLMPETEVPEPSPQYRTTLFKLRAEQCRFVVSDETEAIFCGAPTHAGSSWCPWHRRLVYTKPPSGGVKTGRGFVAPGSW
jgi:hypothetical protein